jgi:hypothetical protein
LDPFPPLKKQLRRQFAAINKLEKRVGQGRMLSGKYAKKASPYFRHRTG